VYRSTKLICALTFEFSAQNKKNSSKIGNSSPFPRKIREKQTVCEKNRVWRGKKFGKTAFGAENN
jgi:hypothetical protein